MYERNALVLERYFNKIFNFNDENNLKQNYYNYRKLLECYGVLCTAKENEEKCQIEFENSSNTIVRLQDSQEKLYNKGAKFEYSRSVIFSNIEEDTDKIEKHLNKVVEDIQKNNDELKELGIKFVETIIDYNNKRELLNDAISQRKKAQKEYDEIYKNARNCYEGLTEEKINKAKEFIDLDDKDYKKELQEIFEENGKNEKNQFDTDVILNTINKSIDIYKIELDVYLASFDKISRLFEEIELNSLKNDKHAKYYRDSEAKIEFISAEKEYIVQFLDNERIGAIYDKKTHRKLMLEACKKFALDFEQIDKLYEIILKEIAGRSTKKIYKENYNKSYLLDLEKDSVEPSLDTGMMRQEAIAFVNLNYWRASGMRSIYDAFENVVTTIYEKDLTEFIPVQEVQEEVVEQVEVEEQKLEENVAQAKISEVSAVDNSEQVKEKATTSKENVKKAKTSKSKTKKSVEKVNVELVDTVENNNVDKIENSEVAKDNDSEFSEILEMLGESKVFEEPAKTEKKSKKTKNKSHILYYSSKKQLARAIFYSLQKHNKYVENDEVVEDVQKNVEEEFVNDNTENVIEDDEKKINIQEIEKDNIEESIYDINELDTLEDVEYEEDDVSEEDVEDVNNFEEYEEDDNEEDEEASILQMYFNDKTEEERDTEEIIKKKVGFFKKLAGFNSKEKKKA